MKPESIELANQRRVELRRATPGDAAAVERLLAAQDLPTAGVAAWLDHFWVAEQDAALVGVAGVELYGDAALLRSVVVEPSWRSSGLGRLLSERAIQEAGTAGARDIYLLATTAESYFPRLGFARIRRELAPAALFESAEFRGACPASAVLMHRPLRGAVDSDAGAIR